MLGKTEEDIVLETGDPELDEIERRLAAGEDPDDVLRDWGEGAGDHPRAPEPLDSAEPEDEEFEDEYRVSEAPASGGLSWSREE
jgi:hypothetical protein